MINRLKNPNPRKKTQIFDILRITHYDILRTLFHVGTFQCHTIVVISYRKFYFIWCNEMYGVCAPASMVIRVVVNIHHNSLFSYQNYVKPIGPPPPPSEIQSLKCHLLSMNVVVV